MVADGRSGSAPGVERASVSVGKRSRSPRLIIFLTVTIDLIGFGVVIPLLPLYAHSFGASGALIGVLFASYSLMQFLFAPRWGRLSDKVGRKPVLLVSIGVSAAAFLVFALAQSYWWLLVARVAAGIGTANLAVATAYIADITPREERAKGMGLIGAAFGIGFVLGPAIGGELGRWGYTAPLLFAAALSIVNLGSAWLLLPESLPPERRDGPSTSGLGARLSALRRISGLPLVIRLVFLHTVAFSMLEMSFVLFAARRFGFDVEESGRFFAYIGVVMIIVQGGFIGRLARRRGERLLAQVGMLAMAVGLGLIPLTPPGRWVLFGLFVTILSVGSAVTSPALQSLVSRSVGAHEQGLAFGLSQSASALARTIGPAAAGLLFDWGSENAPLFAASGLMLGALVLALRPMPSPRVDPTAAPVAGA